MYLYIKKHTGVLEIPKWEKVRLKMEAIVIVTCIGPILGNNFKFSPFSIVKRNLLPQKSILHAKTRCTNSQEWWLALQPKPCPFLPQDRRQGWGITCLSRLALGAIGPGRVLSLAAFAVYIRSIRVTAPESSALHLLISVTWQSETTGLNDSKQGQHCFQFMFCQWYSIGWKGVWFLGMISDQIFWGTQKPAPETHVHGWQDVRWCERGASVHPVRLEIRCWD